MRAKVVLDGVDVTNSCIEGSVTRRLNRPSEASVKVPMSAATAQVGSFLRVYFDGLLQHHGRVLQAETDASEDTGYTTYQSADPLELWKWRPVRDANGNFALPGHVGNATGNNVQADLANLDGAGGTATGPAMIEAIFDNSINAGAGPPSDAEGPLFLAKGTINAGTFDLRGAPQDWPMTMADFASLLISTGEVDIVVTPIETDVDGNIGRLDVYPGNYGYDLSSMVVFSYGMGQRNIRALRWNEDMTNLCNKLWYYLGPKCDEEHWPANITGTAGGAGNPTFWSECGGGDPVQEAQWDAWHAAVVDCAGTGIGSSSGDSRFTYGVRMDIKVLDGEGGTDGDGAASPCAEGNVAGFCFYKKLWLEESILRCLPQTLVHITPIRGITIGEFNVGDLIGVEAAPEVRGGFSGVQRVYEYTVSWDVDSVLTMSELVTTPNSQDGF